MYIRPLRNEAVVQGLALNMSSITVGIAVACYKAQGGERNEEIDFSSFGSSDFGNSQWD